jgi:hypothetical protein
MRLQGQRALVTGGSRSIGQAIALGISPGGRRRGGQLPAVPCRGGTDGRCHPGTLAPRGRRPEPGHGPGALIPLG